MSNSDKPAGQLSNRSKITILLTAVAGIGVVVGMTFPLVTLSLERLNFGATLIGFNSATSSLGILVVGLLCARLLVSHGASAIIISACILSVVSLILMPLSGHVAGWFVLRFMLTLGIGFLWLLSETWLNTLSLPGNRGRIMGLYGTAFSGGLAAGPLIVTLTGSQGWFPFALAGAIMAVSSLPMVLLAGTRDAQVKEQTGHFSLMALHPFIFIVAFVAGLFETTAYALLPIYTLGEGLGESGSLYALSAFSAGGIAFQYPIGKLADSMGRNSLLVLTSISVLLGVIALPFVINSTFLLYGVLIYLGGSIFGLYTLGLIMLGDGFGVKSLVTANAMFIILYESGAVVGPALSGMAMDMWPDRGFVGFLLVSAVLFTGMALKKTIQSNPE